MRETRINIARVIVGAILCHGISSAQLMSPGSIRSGPGVHIHSYDGRDHKSPEHYESLCRVVMKEFGVAEDSLNVNLVFVDETLKTKLTQHNPDRFYTSTWVGVFIKPTLIFMAGEDESDDTFMHEFMHSLHHRGLLFTNVEESEVHRVIHVNEGLLMGSKSYLEYLKTK